jgi:hypothetical protein
MSITASLSISESVYENVSRIVKTNSIIFSVSKIEDSKTSEISKIVINVYKKNSPYRMREDALNTGEEPKEYSLIGRVLLICVDRSIVFENLSSRYLSLKEYLQKVVQLPSFENYSVPKMLTFFNFR